MANDISLFQQYVPLLDEVYKEASKTDVLDGNPDLIRMGANANELIIPKMTMDGLADYSRNGGYVGGDVTLTNETVVCNFDRGRMFTVDSMDDAETAGVAFGMLAGEFIRTKVAPELDAFRFATYASADGVTMHCDNLLGGEEVIAALRVATNAMDDAEVPMEDRILFITPAYYGLIQDMDGYSSREVLTRFSQVIPVPQSRFYTKITQNDGTTSGETTGGYTIAEDGQKINFMVVHKGAVIQFPKHISPKVVSPDMNPDADAWKFGYRQVSIAQVYENKTAGVYVHFHP